MTRGMLLLPLLIAATAACQQPASAESIVLGPVAAVKSAEPKGMKTAIFAGGCFWGIEAVFSHVKGVSSAVSGYHGGSAKTANYATVNNGNTGHAEAVRVRYDPAVVRYDELVRIFFSVGADPTQLNRQGPDVGSQYRSALVPLSPEQSKVANAYLAQLGKAKLWNGGIVTKVEPYRGFFAAEAHHQDFMAANPRHGYILRWDKPKVEGLKALFPGQYKAGFTRG